jgi:hypothetical protein
MVRDSLVTKKQAKILRELGFREVVNAHMWILGKRESEIYTISCCNHNKDHRCLSIPTVDETIDWLRRKYNLIVYNQIEPFVDPTDTSHKSILFKFGVKKCDTNNLGWNGRRDLGTTRLNTNVYSLKREAISIAIKYIKSQKKNVER